MAQPLNLPPFAHENPKDFLYQRKGPWPQPSPGHPMGVAPAVLHLPEAETEDWNAHIGSRYLWTLLTYWPQAAAYALTHPGVSPVDDAAFTHLLCDGVLSRFLDPHLDSADEATFAAQRTAAGPGATLYKCDFTCMGYVTPYPGMYCTPTVALLQKSDDGTFKTLAIAVNNLAVTPSDTHAWQLAKPFVLQGAAHRLILSIHPILHFPMDAVNAITKTSLPMNHVLFKLLIPHLRWTLVLDNMALEGAFSIVNNYQWQVYGCFVGAGDAMRDLAVAGYHGIAGNSSYPAYTWARQRHTIHSNYGVFLDRYWEVIHTFVAGVVAQIPAAEHDHIRRWADYVCKHVTGFPDGSGIMNGSTLSETVATIIWDLSAAHAEDHWDFTRTPINQVPMRMRVPPPAAVTAPQSNPRTWNTFTDVLKYKMAQKMFFAPSNLALLQDTRYGFGNPALDALNNQFLQDLRNLDANPPTRRYIPLHQIACSIQY